MDQKDFDLSAASTDNLSVEAILAEYEAENGKANLNKNEYTEPSRHINMHSQEDSAVAFVGFGSGIEKGMGASSTPSDISEEKHNFSEIFSNIKNNQAVSEGEATQHSPSFENDSSLSMSVDEILLSDKLTGNKEINRRAMPDIKKSALDNQSHISDYQSNSTNDELSSTRRFVSPSKEATVPTREILIDDLSVNFPTEGLMQSNEETAPPSMREVFSEGRASSLDSNPFIEESDDKEPSPSESDDISEISDSSDGSEYADSGDYEPDDDEERNNPERPDIKEKLLTPIIGLMAYSATKREKRRAEQQARLAAMPKQLPPELEPAKAAMLYAQQSDALKFRCIFASILTAILVYISYGLPVFGLLRESPTVLALVCLIFELSVMLVGLDIFTNGIVSIFRKKPGAESLIAVSAIFTAADAIYIAVSGNAELGLPFCGVSALSMTFALWGAKLSCDDFAISFYTASQAKDPYVVMSESGIDDEGCALAKLKRPVTGFVRTAEASDVFEDLNKLFAPVLMVASLVLSLFVYLASKSCTSFIHTLAASICISASLSAIYGFSLPFSVAAKRLARSGVAIAGYSGCAELGRNHRVVITDVDIFPPRTVSVGDISIAEGSNPQKVISYTSSMISAAGMGIASVFTQLMRKNGCVMQKVEDFACHEGGGIIARINGELVYVGTASFMRLMGIRLPKNSANRTAVYTAINDSLAGYFSLDYTPVASVQRALVSLLSGAGEPVFAIRDFNITPMLLKQKFRLPSGSYDFPSFADRYRISSPEYEENGTVAAMFSRGGLNSVAGLTKRGRRLYISIRFIAGLSILGSVIGMVMMLAMCWGGSYSSASCANIMTYMLLWLVPVFVVSYGLRR